MHGTFVHTGRQMQRCGESNWCLTSTQTAVRLIRDGKNREGGGGGGMAVGKREIIYLYRYTVTTTMTPALRWAAMRDILMCD